MLYILLSFFAVAVLSNFFFPLFLEANDKINQDLVRAGR
jgi:hypothetical protein